MLMEILHIITCEIILTVIKGNLIVLNTYINKKFKMNILNFQLLQLGKSCKGSQKKTQESNAKDKRKH